jgi:hypothetical protein
MNPTKEWQHGPSESSGWLKLLDSTDLVTKTERFQYLLGESAELARIFNQSYQTARRKDEQDRQKRPRRNRRSSDDKAHQEKPSSDKR